MASSCFGAMTPVRRRLPSEFDHAMQSSIDLDQALRSAHADTEQ
jgi:hypothetical protein